MQTKRSTAPNQLAAIRQQLARYIPDSIASAGADDNLIELGLDSLHVLALVNQWRASGIVVSFSQLIDRPTLQAWLLLLQADQEQQA